MVKKRKPSIPDPAPAAPVEHAVWDPVGTSGSAAEAAAAPAGNQPVDNDADLIALFEAVKARIDDGTVFEHDPIA